MDRRTFLAGIGTVGVAAAAAGGLSEFSAHERAERSRRLATAAGAMPGSQAGTAEHGLTLGVLAGGHWLLEDVVAGRRWDVDAARRSRWLPWDVSHSMMTYHDKVAVSIGLLRPARVAAPAVLQSLEVVAHFAMLAAPEIAHFDAWSYRAAAPGKRGAQPSPLAFDASLHQRVALQVDYMLAGPGIAPRVRQAGMLYVPLGGREGPGVGIYALAGPSRITGAPPDFREYHFSGNVDAPLERDTGGSPDFDYVTLRVSPAWS